MVSKLTEIKLLIKLQQQSGIIMLHGADVTM